MILVDTSVWIDFLRRGLPALGELLERGEVLMHPFVLGELACGNLKAREQILADLARLPRVKVAQETEVLHFMASHALMGRGVGYLDMHLLASARLSEGVRLWTLDKKLAEVAGDVLPQH